MEIAEVDEAPEAPYLDYKQLEYSPKQQLVLILSNPSPPSGFCNKVNKCIVNHFDHLAQHPQVHLRKESFKSIYKGNFSAAVLIAHDFEAIAAAAQLLDKKADEYQYGQLNLNIVTVNIKQSQQQVKQLFSKA